jgi:hypothetical protein
LSRSFRTFSLALRLLIHELMMLLNGSIQSAHVRAEPVSPEKMLKALVTASLSDARQQETVIKLRGTIWSDVVFTGHG